MLLTLSPPELQGSILDFISVQVGAAFSMNSSQQTKQEHRRKLREKRASLSSRDRELVDKSFLNFLNQIFAQRKIQWLSYLEIDNEFPTKAHFDWAKSRGESVFFPAVTGEQMIFRKLDFLSDALKSNWGKEPPLSNRPWKASDGFTVALVPGVGFDFDLHRLGFGKGYYDRFLRSEPSVYKLGLAYSFQVQPSSYWTSETHDIQMDGVYSPQGFWGHFPTF